MAARKWTPEEIAEVTTNYATCNIGKMAAKLQVSTRQLRGLARRRGLKRMERKKWNIRKVAPERSQLNVIDLLESRQRIAHMIFDCVHIETAKRLEAIYKDLNIAISMSL